MVSAKVLIDTNILVDYLSGLPQARSLLDRSPDRAISLITWMEIMTGTIPTDEKAVRAFLNSFRILPITQEVAEQAVALRKRRKIKLPDAIIRATASNDGRTLLTRDTRAFPKGEAGVSVPYEI